MFDEQYDKLLKKRKIWYFRLGSLFSECVNTEVVFDARGFHHLVYDGTGKIRTKSDRIRRLNLVVHVPRALETGSMMQRMRNGYPFYAVFAKVKGINITVILKNKREKLLFWSVQ